METKKFRKYEAAPESDEPLTMELHPRFICAGKELEEDMENWTDATKKAFSRIVGQNLMESQRKLNKEILEKYGDTNPFGSAPI